MVKASCELAGMCLLALFIAILAARDVSYPYTVSSPEPVTVASSDGISMPFSPPPEEAMEEK